MKSATLPNRLAREKSPYLQQHQFNPVDWYPWGDEAFAKARQEDKMIFLSIGYSTCHWCHVMERESFENHEVADYLNRHFVSIKVDREERSDLDRIYLRAVTATTGQGGWPLSVFLTPQLQPFYGGTYFPPRTRQGRIGFLELLQRLQDLWQNQRADIENASHQLIAHLRPALDPQPPNQGELTEEILRQASRRLQDAFDPDHGGFGPAPKFPHPTQPGLLLRCGVRFSDDQAIAMVLKTCDRMAAGGIHDHLGGGFARYAVDAAWIVPHFEKMLYDNALLAQLYLEAYLVSRQSRHADVAGDILEYVQRDLAHPDGGFFSAEDADSEGKEGKFYCWTRSELARLLSPEEFNVTAQYYGITEQGNFLDHSDPHPLPGQNVLHVAQPSLSADDRVILNLAKKKMIAARNQRPRPLRDEKILSSWNGLMLGAFARAGVVLQKSGYLATAESNLAFIQRRLWDASTRTLFHRWRDGEHDTVQLLSAYAFMLAGVLDLYQATLLPQHLEFALALAESMISRFHDASQGGFWPAARDTPDLILPLKEDHDGAEPAANSIAVLSLLRLGAITGRDDLVTLAQAALRAQADAMHRHPEALTCLLQALDFSLQEPSRLVVAGDPATQEPAPFLEVAYQQFHPHLVILGTTGPVDEFSRQLVQRHQTSAAFFCTGTVCHSPALTPEDLRQQLTRQDLRP